MRAVSPIVRFLLVAVAVGTLATLVLPLRMPVPIDVAAAQNNDAATDENPFPGRFEAADLNQGGEWLNTERPLTKDDLKGKVVLLDFWTYCCINCIHVLPDLHQLEQDFPNELVVVGVHVPKFDNEQETENIREAVLRYEIEHPVVNDAGHKIADEYGFRAWPTLVIVDPEGQYVGFLSGEGNYDTLKSVITKMIAYHKGKGTLDPRPNDFKLERATVEPTPLRYPGKVLATEDRLFISDSNHNRVVVTDTAGKLLHTIGGPQPGNADGDFAAARFDHPQGMALDGETLYVADTENHTIRSVDLTTLQVTTLAGTGEQDRTRTTGGPLDSTALNSPWDLLMLGDTLYIAMAGPHQLWQHAIGTDEIGVFAGSGREDITDGPLRTAALAQPSGLATDGTSIFFVCSEGSAVRKATPGGSVETIAGPRGLSSGRALFEFGDKNGPGREARFQHPLGVAFDGDRLLVADTYNHTIREVALPDGTTSTWAGTGEDGNGVSPIQFDEPAGLSIAGSTVYVADTNNHRIVTLDAKTGEASVLTIEGLDAVDMRE